MDETAGNIFFIASWYPSIRNRSLGIFIRRHADALALKHRVTVIHVVADADMKAGEFRINRKEEGQRRDVILYYGKHHKGWKLRRAYRNWRLMKQHLHFAFQKAVEWSGMPNVLHLQVIWPLGGVAAQLSRKHRIPLYITEHWTGYQPEDGRYRGRMMKMITRKAIQRATTIVTVSQQLQKAMEACGLHGRYTQLANVVDTAAFKPDEGASRDARRHRFIHISSLDDAQKNVTGLLRAFAAARKHHPKLELWIVGSGNDESRIRLFSNELGLSQRGVSFYPHAGPELLNSYLNQCGALVLNSRYENQPVVILEAFAAGLPVVVPDVGGISEICESRRAIVFKANDESALSAALLEMAQSAEMDTPEAIADFAGKNFGMQAVAEAAARIYL